MFYYFVKLKKKKPRIKLHDIVDLKEASSVVTINEDNRIENCQWSSDGRMLAVTTITGNVHVYLTVINKLASVSPMSANIAVLTSLKEV